MHRSYLLAGALALALPAVSQGALWSLQYSGIQTVYDSDRAFANLGLPVSAGGPGAISGNFATLSDATLNADQSFGSWAEGTDLLNEQLDIFKDGVFYDTLTGVRADFRFILETEIDFSQSAGIYAVDESRSFFDLFMDEDPSDCNPANSFACTTGAWGIALDTDESIAQFVINVLDNSTIAALTGTIFTDNPGTFDLPTVTDNGLPFGSIIFGPSDEFTFNLSTTIDLLTPGCPTVGACTGQEFEGLSSGEVSFRSEVPEPGVLAMLGLGLIGMVSIQRLRR